MINWTSINANATATLLGAPAGKRIILFVDDLNMPKLDTYGSQPPIELLRQYQDFGGLYDREKLFWKEINVSCKSSCFAIDAYDLCYIFSQFFKNSHCVNDYLFVYVLAAHFCWP